ncbi:MAG: hypothetical protein E7324_00845 [Clostridiales bacterium]|nr:hypothetical protein [Clostridiales bacterium]
MAQYEAHLQGNFNDLLNYIEHQVMQGSSSASREGGSFYEIDGVRCAVRVYERYSYMGGNRLSLNVTLFGKDDELYLTAVTAGGSQALFFKINTWGEQSFLAKFVKAIEAYQKK